MESQEFLQRLTDVHSDADTSNFNILDFLGPFGSPFQAILYSHLFWPNFVEFEGMIFMQDLIETEEDRNNIRRYFLKAQSTREVEKSFNQFPIPSSFFNINSFSTTDQENLYLAHKLAEIWDFRLKQLFPEKQFEIVVMTAEETDDQPTISICQS